MNAGLLLLSALYTLSARAEDRPLVIVVGMASEAEIARGGGTLNTIVVGAMNENALRARLSALDSSLYRGVISFGVAGGLDPALPVGSLVVPDEVANDSRTFVASAELNASARSALSSSGVAFSTDRLAGVEQLSEGTDDQRNALAARYGSGAVDMESHIAADFAARTSLPFLAFRAVSDSYGDVMPPAALLPLDADGNVQMSLVLWSIFLHPSQVADLARVQGNFKTATDTLSRVRAALPGLFR